MDKVVPYSQAPNQTLISELTVCVCLLRQCELKFFSVSSVFSEKKNEGVAFEYVSTIGSTATANQAREPVIPA